MNQYIVQLLVATDDLDKWAEHVTDLDIQARTEVYADAEPLWIKRMLLEEKLIVHPEVANALAEAQWQPTTKHRQMIWASVLTGFNGDGSKERFNSMKEKLVKKYGNKWWFQVYQRIKPTYAARKRLEELRPEPDSVVAFMAANTLTIGLAAKEEREAVLRKLSKD